MDLGWKVPGYRDHQPCCCWGGLGFSVQREEAAGGRGLGRSISYGPAGEGQEEGTWGPGGAAGAPWRSLLFLQEEGDV